MNSHTLKGYYWRRFLRLYPGLFVVLLLTIFLSPLLYDCKIPFFKNIDVYTYLPNNLSFYWIQYSIQGVLTKNTYHGAINGSLWTICYEFTLYLLLSVLILFRNNIKIVQGVLLVLFIIMYIGYVFYFDYLSEINFIGLEGKHFLNLGNFFICGSLLSSFQIEKMNYKKIGLGFIFFIFIISIYFGFYNLLKHILFTILILLLALNPINKICKFGKIGDLSYGIYIYSFPIQQILMYFFKFNGKQLLFMSLVLSIFFGFFSWHLIEKKAMSYKSIIS
jgi:peptidoglycan/LPS O-acetylase OafA/YrhL